MRFLAIALLVVLPAGAQTGRFVEHRIRLNGGPETASTSPVYRQSLNRTTATYSFGGEVTLSVPATAPAVTGVNGNYLELASRLVVDANLNGVVQRILMGTPVGAAVRTFLSFNFRDHLNQECGQSLGLGSGNNADVALKTNFPECTGFTRLPRGPDLNGQPTGVLYTQAYAFGGATGVDPRGGDNLCLTNCVGVEIQTIYVFDIAYDVEIDHIETVQVVQDKDNTVPLIQGKPTVIRVFPKAGATPIPLTGLSAELSGAFRGAQLPGSPLAPFNGPITVPTAPQRDNADHSLNFYLPFPWTNNSSINLVVNLKLPAGLVDPTPANNQATASFNFRPGGSLNIAYVPVCLSAGAGSICPTAAIARYDSQVERLFPVAPVNLNYTALAVPKQVLRSGICCGSSLDAYLRALFALMASNYDQLAAWLPDLVSPPNNYRITGSSDPRWFESTATGRVSWQQDWTASDPNYPARTLAHEIAHNLGRRHTHRVDGCGARDAGTDWPVDFPRSNIQEVGFDPIAREVKPASLFDLMTYCAPPVSNTWISPFTYNQLMQGGFRPQSDPAKRFAEGDFIIVTGMAKRDGTGGSLQAAYRVSTGEAPGPAPSSPTHCLRFFGDSGQLGEQCMALTFREHQTDAVVDEEWFTVNAPFPAGTRRIGLFAGSSELALLRPGPGAPQISIITPQPNDVWNGGGRTITWSASDPDGDTLTYSVLYSADAGATWIPVEKDTTLTSYSFSPDEIDGGKTVRFRVLATDGLNTTAAEAGPIEVVQNPRLLLAADRLDFRKIVLRQARDLPVVVSNPGTGPLRISSLAAGSEEFTMRTRAPLMIPAGQSQTITIRFSPEQVGLREARLAIVSNDAAAPRVEVILSGRGIAAAEPDLNVPARVDFGSVIAGGNKDATLAIRNAGGAALTVNTLAFNNAAFRVVSPAAPINIAAGATTNVTLRFAAGANAGDQAGQLTIASNDPSAAQAVVAVAATVVAGAVPVSSAAGVVSAASFLGGPVAAGEIVTIFGTTIGPPSIAGLALNAQGLVATTVGETRVLFDGVPAPIIYALAGQTSVIVPYAVAGRASTQMVVEYQGRRSDPVTLPVAPSAPSLFSADSSGRGPGAILNQDGSVNTPGNPADKDSVIVLFGTGEGRTEPEGVDGRLATSVFPKPRLAVTATVGGLPAEVLYAGAAPNLVSGVLQVNVKVPPGVASGNVPVVVTVGVASSQGGLTVAVR